MPTRRNRHHKPAKTSLVAEEKTATYEQNLARKEAAGELGFIASASTALGLFLTGNLSGNAAFSFYGTIGFTAAVASETMTFLVQLRDGLDSNQAAERRRAAREFIAKMCVVVPFTAGLIQYFMSDDNFEDKASTENFFGTVSFAVGIAFKCALTMYFTAKQIEAFRDDKNQSSMAMLVKIIFNLAEPAGFVAGAGLFAASNREANSSYALYGIASFMGGVAAKTANFAWNTWENRTGLFGSIKAETHDSELQTRKSSKEEKKEEDDEKLLIA